jgi:ParB/RepB/Spo0J family partition protein
MADIKKHSMREFVKQQAAKADANLIKRSNSPEIKKVAEAGIIRHELADALNKKAKYAVISYKDLLIDDITFQKRAFNPNIEDLKAKIKRDGQQTAIAVRPAPDNKGKYQIIAGFSRGIVCTELKRDVSVKIYEGATDEECLLIAIDENVVRNDMRAVDIINYIHAIEKQYPGITMNDVADIIGKRRSSLFSYIKIEKCPDVLKALTTERITLRTAVELSALEDAPREKALAAEIETNAKKSEGVGKDKKPAKKPPFKLFIDAKKKTFKLPSLSATYAERHKVIESLQEVISKLKELKED